MDYQSGYAHYLTEEKRASANTLSSYLRDVTQYLHWLEGEGVPPEQAAQKDVESYTRFLSAKGKSAATVTRSLASLKSFYSYLIAEGRVSVNPARGLAPAKVERKLPPHPYLQGGGTLSGAAGCLGCQGLPRPGHAGAALCHGYPCL